MPAPKIPWLDYSGQTASEIIDCKSTHRIDSLLCALEEGILLRQSRQGKKGTTAEERILLAVMALDREVNNGGYDQFFVNLSHEYASMIVRALQRIGCSATATLTSKAIDALNLDRVTAKTVSRAILNRDPKRRRTLSACDKQYYKLAEIEPKLFEFVESHRHKFVLERMSVPPRPKSRGFTNVSRVFTKLQFTPKTDRSVDAVRSLARELATQDGIEATDAEIEGATYLYLFGWFLRAGDLAACEPLAPLALEFAREDTTHCVLHYQWVEKLVGASHDSLADAAALQYLEYLNADEKSSEFIAKRIRFWEDLIRRHAAALPGSVRFFRTNFSIEQN